MQIQGMTIEEVKNRVEIGLVELDKDDVWKLLKYAVTAEVKLDYFEDLKAEIKTYQADIHLLEIENKYIDSECLGHAKNNNELKSIIEEALDFIKTLNLEDNCKLDSLINTLERGMRL